MRIMFVCHGNICRSPMAEFVLKDMVKRAGREGEFVIASSATSTDEIRNGRGNPVYPPAKDELARHGISCSGKRAVQFTKEDYDKYDLIIAMDSRNVRNIYRIIGNDSQNKVRKLMDYTLQGGDVADPWYTRNFETAYNDIYNGCKALLQTF